MLTETNPFSSFSTDKLLDSYLFYKDLLGLEVELVNDQFIHLNAYGCSTKRKNINLRTSRS